MNFLIFCLAWWANVNAWKQLYMNKKIFYIIVSVLVMLGIAIYGYIKAVPGIEDESAPRPKIEISPLSFEFGEVEFGQVLRYSFSVKNAGNKTLEIRKIGTSCSCTTAEAEKTTLSAGEETNINVTYNTGLMGGVHGQGRQERIIYIKTNDPVTPQKEVTIYAYVE